MDAQAGPSGGVPPHPPPPFAQLLGRTMHKDFHCDILGRVRPFRGTVVDYYAKNGW